MDILLIDPPYITLKGMPIERGYNLGLTSIAAYIRNEGLETAVLTGDLLADLPSHQYTTLLDVSLQKYAAGQHDYEMAVNDRNHAVWQKLAALVGQTRPMAVGIPYLTPLKHVVEKIASLVREVSPDIKIIVGSFHPTFCPEEVMQNPNIDFVIGGEGEIPLLNLIKELKKDSPRWESIPRISYRTRDGQVKNNSQADMISNLDELPFPARDLVLNCDYTTYKAHCISTSRGCPYTCSFCADRSLWGGRVRRRSVENVIEELRLLRDTYKPSYVDFVDGTFTFDRKYLERFCNTMIDQKLNIQWRCTARYDNLDEDLLQLMKKSNCTGLYLGFESGSNRVLNTIDKHTTVEQNIRVSKMIYRSGIPSVTAIMLGLPGEGKDDMEETLRSMKIVKTDLFDINCYIPLAGTPLYDAMSEEEKKDIDWKKVGYKSFYTHFSNGVSSDDLKGYLTRAYDMSNKVRKKTLVRFGAKTVLRSLAGVFKKP